MIDGEQARLRADDVEEEGFSTGWDNTTSTEFTGEQKSPPLRIYTHNFMQAQTALLDNEVVSTQTDIEAFRLIRTHYAAIEQWHEAHTGWRIQRSSTFFRLERHRHAITPVFTDDKLKRPRDFACLLWLLWFAEQRYLAGGGRNQQFLLSQLAEELQTQTQLVGGPEKQLDFRNQNDRYSIWRALDYLARLGAVQSLEGETKKWVEDAPENEVLYEFTGVTHSLIEALYEQHVELFADRLADPTQFLLPASLPTLAENIPALNRAWRALLLGPALLRYDDQAAFRALLQHADQISDELAESFNWQLELNSDYACIVRGGSLSSGSGPTLTLNSSIDQMILLLCGTFRQQVATGTWSPDSYGCLRVPQGDIAPLFNELRQHYGMHWGSRAQTTKGLELLEEIYQKMRQLGLLRGPDATGEMLILPTAARYDVSYAADEPTEARSRPARARTKEKVKQNPVPQISLLDLSGTGQTGA